MVASVIGWIFAGIGILVLVFLLCPVIVGISYRDETFGLTVRLLGFIKLTLYPQDEEKQARKDEKNARKRRKKQKKKDEEAQKKPKRKRTLRQWLYLIKRIAHSAGAAKSLILRALHIYDFEFVLAVHEEEASDTAIRFGQLQAAVGGVRAILENIIKIRYKTLVIIPDFAGQYATSPTFSCKVAACPVIMLIAGIVGFRAFLRFRKIYGREPLSKEQQRELDEKREKLREERRKQREQEAAQQKQPPKTA